MMPIKTYKKIKTIVLYFVIKNLKISSQNGVNMRLHPQRKKNSLLFLPKINFFNSDKIPKILYFKRNKNEFSVERIFLYYVFFRYNIIKIGVRKN